MSLPTRSVINISDLRRLAKRRLPSVAFDYIDGGADGEVTLQENVDAFRAVKLRPRSGVEASDCALCTTVLGQEIALPILLAPVGSSRLLHPAGEIAAATAAGRFGTGYILSTLSGYPLEKVRAASAAPLWYQVYKIGGREAAEAAIQRAKVAGYSALVLTIDTALSGLRERDVRNGTAELLSGNLFSKLPLLPNLLSHPRWLISFLLDGGLNNYPNVVIPGKGPLPITEVSKALRHAAVAWDDMIWIRKIWPGPIVVKGVLSAEEARLAVDRGATAVVVSNHGGRQLDCVPATLTVLPEVVKAVGSQAEVLLDGGIRRGSDVIKAICLGAKAVLIGRGYAYGMAAAGEDGIVRALEIFRTDMLRTLKLLGCGSLSDLGPSYIRVPAHFHSA